jgi:hypothetical protein
MKQMHSNDRSSRAMDRRPRQSVDEENSINHETAGVTDEETSEPRRSQEQPDEDTTTVTTSSSRNSSVSRSLLPAVGVPGFTRPLGIWVNDGSRGGIWGPSLAASPSSVVVNLDDIHDATTELHGADHDRSRMVDQQQREPEMQRQNHHDHRPFNSASEITTLLSIINSAFSMMVLFQHRQGLQELTTTHLRRKR